MFLDSEVSTAEMQQTELRSLEAFVTGNQDLHELEALTKRFNIFESLGVVRNELRHSSFLASLLDPSGSHGLRDLFLKRVLQEALLGTPGVSSWTPIEVDVTDFRYAEISVETYNIDVLIVDSTNKLAVIIENKFDSTQHSGQLTRYYELVHRLHPDFQVFGIYLTRNDEDPEHKNYAALSHSTVCRLVNELIQRSNLILEDKVLAALQQYTDMLGRHFMADEKIQALCLKIYKQHRRALDLIWENLPDRRDYLRDKLKQLIEQDPSLELDACGTNYVRFIPKRIDLEYLKGESGWTESGRVLLFEFKIAADALSLVLQIGPGDTSKRKGLLDLAHTAPEVFNQTEKKLNTKWNRLYRRQFLGKIEPEQSEEETFVKVRKQWNDFLTVDLPKIEDKLLSFSWPIATDLASAVD